MAHLSELKLFDVSTEPTSLGIAWNKWTRRLVNLFTAMKITEQPLKKVMLLHYAGEDVNDIYETLGDNDTNHV